MTTLRNCDGGHTCSPPKECCKQGCCYPQESTIFRAGPIPSSNMFTLVVGHWYFWAATTATLLGIMCACSLWRRQSTGSSYFCCWGDGAGSSRIGDEHVSEPDSNGSCYAPPQYSRCGSFHQAPPPYSEVTSKPDLYPLVISYNGDAVIKTNGSSTGYLMVQYFRNFIVRPVGTLSATSTIDSLSSSFICNAANEANNIIPPPYSCTGSLEEVSVVVTANNNSHTYTNHTAPQQPQPLPPTTTFNVADVTTPPTTTTPTSTILGVSPTESQSLSLAQLVSSQQRQRDLVQQFLNSPRREVIDLSEFAECRQDNLNLDLVIGSKRNSREVVLVEQEQRQEDDVDEEQVMANCEATTKLINFSSKREVREIRLKEKFKPKHQQSLESESDQEHNFSDLLNLSVCAPSSLVASSVVNTQSNPQMDMIYNSVTNSMTSSDISSLANLGTPDSPPRATSPTLEMRELLDKIQQLPAQHKSPVSSEAPKLKHYFNRSKAKTLYMPLTAGGGGGGKDEKKTRGWLSRSAPTTPCGSFMPNFPSAHHNHTSGGKRSGSQKGSRSKLFDGSPLLREHDESDEDNERS